jgi:hypothetical protein
MLGHQFPDFCEDPVCGLLVFSRKSLVYLDGRDAADAAKQGIIGFDAVELYVGLNGQSVKYLVYWDRPENKYDIHLFRVCSLVGYHN